MDMCCELEYYGNILDKLVITMGDSNASYLSASSIKIHLPSYNPGYDMSQRLLVTCPAFRMLHFYKQLVFATQNE